MDASLAPHPNFTVLGFVAKTETPTETPPPSGAEGYGEMGAYVNATWLDRDWRIDGEYVDLVDQDFYGGTRQDVQLKLGARISDRFSTEAQYTRNAVELPLGDFDVDLAALRVDLAPSSTWSTTRCGAIPTPSSSTGIADSSSRRRGS